jgi:hypothetical protein
MVGYLQLVTWLQAKIKSFDEAGGMYESLNYANFGIQEALQYRIAWQNTTPRP